MARQKQVFHTREVFHKWAHGSQPAGRNSCGNASFNMEFLFSYQEPIARRIMKNLKTREVVYLIRDYTFSVTTSRHQSHARSAITRGSDVNVFHVAHIGGSSNWESGYNAADEKRIDHKRNLKHYAAGIAKLADKLSKSRAHIDWRLRELESMIGEANRYATYYKLRTRFDIPAGLDLEKLKAREARHTDKSAAREEERRIAREKRAEALRIESAELITRWTAGDTVQVPYGLGKHYLRVQGEEVVTTLGARVPLEHVKRALRVVVPMLEHGRTYKRNGHSIHLGDYVLDEINEEGTIRAGCHTFDKAEVLRFASTVAARPAGWDKVETSTD
jgi:hypothetical protein